MKAIFIFLFSAILSVSTAIPARSAESDTMSIGIGKFYMTSGDSSFLPLQILIPALLEYTLRDQQIYKVERIPQPSDQSIQPSNRQQLNAIKKGIAPGIPSNKVYDFQIDGSYTVYLGKVNCVLYLLDNKTGVRLTYATGYFERLDALAELVKASKDILKTVQNLDHSFMRHSILVRNAMTDVGQDKEFRTFMQRLYISRFNKYQNYTFITPDSNSLATTTEMIDQYHLDFIVNSELKKINKEYVLSAYIECKGVPKEQRIELIEQHFKDRYETDYYFNTTIKDIQSILSVIVNSDNSWDQELIEKKEKYFTKKSIQNYVANKNYDMVNYYAIHCIRKNISLDTAYYLKGLSERGRFNVEEAKKCFTTCLEKNSNYNDAYFQLGEIQIQQGDFDLAFENFMRLKNKNYKDIDFYLGKIKYYQLKDQEAKVILKRALTTSTDKSIKGEASVLLGNIYLNAGMKDSSFYYYNLAYNNGYHTEEVNNGLKEIYLAKGIDLYYQKKYTDAIAQFKTSQSYVVNADAYYYLIKSYNRQFNFEKALDNIQEASTKNVIDYKRVYTFQVQDLISIQYKTLDSLKENRQLALKCLDTLSQVESNLAQQSYFQQLKGLVNFELQDYKKALPLYQQALKQDPHEIVNYLNLAELQLINYTPKDAISTLAAVKSNLKKDEITNSEYYYIQTLLTYISYRMSGKEYSSSENDLNRMISTSKNFKSHWSFYTFKNWLKTSTIDSTTKENIQNYISKIESLTVSN